MATAFVYFDLAHTLIHKPALLPAIERTLGEHGLRVPRERIQFAHRLALELVPLPDVTDREFYLDFNARFLETLGVIPTPVLAARLFDACDGLAWTVCADVAALDLISLPMGILSNWSRTLDATVTALLGRPFAPIVGSAATGLTKPDPRLYHLAAAECGHAPDAIMMVGDSIRLDIAPTLALGMRAVLIDREGHFPYFDGERITALTQLPDLLDGR